MDCVVVIQRQGVAIFSAMVTAGGPKFKSLLTTLHSNVNSVE